ncbi:Uncharacterized protein BM_BM6867 [Brugia malayi]|nr:Uncharacterized protein BM_BM6867 [Brugia malayi]CDP93017.1 BMA-VHA-19, isoform f [Brugia malayi]VIO87417.1 Uncharacterized protein BM_BM6867 [Brugia malayi]
MDNRQRLSASDRHDMPVVLPPPNPSQKTACLLYMEAFDIIISNSRFLTVGSEGKNKYSSGPDHCKCNVNSSQGRASFIIDVEVGENIEDAEKEFYLTSGTTITFQLDFLRSRNGYWYLDGTKLKNNFKINALRAKQNLNVSSGTATNQVDVGAVFNRNFACFQTDAAVFKVLDGKYSNIGIALRNFEVALELVGDKTRFGYRTSDCVGTFSAGSWMVFAGWMIWREMAVQHLEFSKRLEYGGGHYYQYISKMAVFIHMDIIFMDGPDELLLFHSIPCIHSFLHSVLTKGEEANSTLNSPKGQIMVTWCPKIMTNRKRNTVRQTSGLRQ